MDWYYAHNDQKVGPVSEEKIIELARVGTVAPNTLVWHGGMSDWGQWSVAGSGLAMVSSDSSILDAGPCAECRQTFEKGEMISLDGNWICAQCKPLVVQRMREGVAPISGGIWRSNKSLVISLDSTFPERCVKCNLPTTNERMKRKLFWHHPAFYLALLVNILIYAIVAMCVRKKASALISVCPVHRDKRRIALIVGWTLSVGGIATLTIGGINNSGLIILLGFVAFLVGIVYGIARGRLIRATKITKDNAWVAGCCPAFLAEFPEWNTSR